LGKAICKMLAGGVSLNQICKRHRMPARSRVLEWAHNPDHPFSDSYVRAREIGFYGMADEITEIADDGRNDWVERENKKGEPYIALDREAVMRSQLRVDTRKWILARVLPKVYGARNETTHKLDASDAFVELWRAVAGGGFLPPVPAQPLTAIDTPSEPAAVDISESA
jgi:hypothetical protein